MAYEQLAKPGTVTGNAIVEGAISSNSLSSNTLFFIKPTAVIIQSAVEVVETTGDIDTERVFENGRLKGLSSADNDGNSNASCSLSFYPHSGRKISGTVVFSQVDIEWARKSPYVGVNISGYFTSVDFTGSNEES